MSTTNDQSIMNRRRFLLGSAAFGVAAALPKEALAADRDVSDTTGQVYEPNLRGSHPKYGQRLYDGHRQVFAETDCGIGEVFLQKGMVRGKPTTLINVIITSDQDHTAGVVIRVKPGTATVINGQWAHTSQDHNLSRFIAKGLIDPNSQVITNNNNEQHCTVVSRSNSNPDTPGQAQPPAPPPPPPQSGGCDNGPC